MLINTASDFQAVPAAQERTAFLQAMLDDYITFDDAVYPTDYDRMLQPGDTGYIKPVLRKEWNAAAAAGWGFTSREQIEDLKAKEAALSPDAGSPEG